MAKPYTISDTTYSDRCDASVWWTETIGVADWYRTEAARLLELANTYDVDHPCRPPILSDLAEAYRVAAWVYLTVADEIACGRLSPADYGLPPSPARR